MRRTALLAVALGAVALPAAAAEWAFRVDLDGQTIGQHRFQVATRGDEREVASDAAFTVKLLGFTAYRYEHHARERWKGDCLVSLASTTDDNGKPVHARVSPRLEACRMSYAYWNPALREQSHLVNAQTGTTDAVRVEAVEPVPIEFRGQPVRATGFRLVGPKEPLTVWYGPDGDWIGLDATVEGGRRLTYRIP